MSHRAPSSTDRPQTAPYLFGREREQALLQQHVTQLLTGTGGVVLVSGETGIGKTTLVTNIAREAKRSGALVLTGYCHDMTITPPYGPWIDMVTRYNPASDMPGYPVFLHDAESLAALQQQEALFAQLRTFFTAVAAVQPLVLILEDLHWADQASLELLRFLAQHISNDRLLLVVTYRDDELPQQHGLYRLLPVLAREAPATRCDLARWNQATVRKLVSKRYELAGTDRERLVTYLQNYAEGNPLFTEELLRTLEHQGSLHCAGGAWVYEDAAGTHVPPLLRQMIDRRLEQLGDETRYLLAVAAVIGQHVPIGLWGAVTDADDEVLTQAIEEAMHAHVLVEELDLDAVAFSHALVREAVYEGVIVTRRRVWHRLIGEALSKSSAPDPDTVAAHFQHADDARAADWLIRAGERAERSYAFEAARERYEAALNLLEPSGAGLRQRGWLLYRLAEIWRYADPYRGLALLDDAERVARGTSDHSLAALCAWSRARMLGYMGKDGLADLVTADAALDALSEGDRERIASVLGHDVDVLRRTNSQWLALYGRYDDALEAGTRYLQTVAMREPSGAWFDAEAYFALGAAHAALGQPYDAQHELAKAVESYERSRNYLMADATIYIQLLEVTLPFYADNVVERRRLARQARQLLARANRATSSVPEGFSMLPALVLEGRWDEVREVTSLVPKFDPWRSGMLSALAMVARLQGDRDEAWSRVHEGIGGGPETEPSTLHYIFTLTLQRLAAELALDEDDHHLARCWIEAHDRWLAWSGRVLNRADGQLLWARYHRYRGDLERARRHTCTALKHASSPRQPLALMAVYHFLGRLDVEAGRYDEAEAHLATSLSIAQASSAPYRVALTQLIQAQLHSALGSAEQARAILDDVRKVGVALGAEPLLKRVDQLTAQLAGTAYPAGLTQRQVDVLKLLVDGLTNAEIAGRLSISPRTVDHHLRSIYSKFDVPSRGAAIRIALERGIAGAPTDRANY